MKLLVYIPCWKNYAKAWSQLEELQKQSNLVLPLSPSLELQIVISMNAVSDIEEIFQRRFKGLGSNFKRVKENIGDTNINLGFLEALAQGADLLWILSPEDVVSKSALANIFEKFSKYGDLDFVVADETRKLDYGENRLELKGRETDLSFLSQASYGLVSGLVLKVKSFRSSMHFGLQSAHTCWGQLAVFLATLRRTSELRGLVVPAEQMYCRGDKKVLNFHEKRHNVYNYASSFFGYVLILQAFSLRPKKEINDWVRSNWFTIGMYKRSYYENPQKVVRIFDNFENVCMVISRLRIWTRFMFWSASKLNLARIKGPALQFLESGKKTKRPQKE